MTASTGDTGLEQTIHQRQLIREAVVAALKADAPFMAAMNTMNGNVVAADKRIYDTRLIEWQERHMPAISVYNGTDTVDPESDTSTQRELMRTMPVTIEVGVLGPLPEAKLDAICLHVERIMHKDETIGGTCSKSLLTSTEFEFTADGEQYIGVAFIVFTVTFYTYAPYMFDQNMGEFLNADVDYNLGNEQDEPEQARDEITVRGA